MPRWAGRPARARSPDAAGRNAADGGTVSGGDDDFGVLLGRNSRWAGRPARARSPDAAGRNAADGGAVSGGGDDFGVLPGHNSRWAGRPARARSPDAAGRSAADGGTVSGGGDDFGVLPGHNRMTVPSKCPIQPRAALQNMPRKDRRAARVPDNPAMPQPQAPYAAEAKAMRHMFRQSHGHMPVPAIGGQATAHPLCYEP